ncbi:MAG TPA: restriction endonuclease subunit S [Gemmatimonadales bacterium]|nr:restriction endonuclease subunit S [Gemmatimonadales bacterium]
MRLLDEFLRSAFLEMFGDPVRNEKRWEVVALGDLLVRPLRNGLSPAKGGRIPARVLTLTAITGSRFEPTAVKMGQFARLAHPDQSAHPNDFLICRGNGNVKLMGRARFPRDIRSGTLFPDTMIAARVDPARIQPAYLEAVWAMPAVRRGLESGSRTTSGIHKVNQKILTSIRFPLPPLERQQEYASIVDRVERLREQLSSAASTELFDSLAQQAFRGEA